MKSTGKFETIWENHLFSRLYSKGKSYSGRTVTIYFMRNYAGRGKSGASAKPRTAVDGVTRIGITVSKSRGNAVVRNRIKRRIREALRLLHPFMKEGFLIVVVARQPAATAPYSEVSDELFDLLKRAALLGEAR